LNFNPNGKKVNKATNAQKEVWVKRPTGLVAVNITTGDTDGIKTEVKQGLTLGDEVVIGYKATEVAPANAGAKSETSPFMPKRPGDSRKKTTTKQ